MTGEGPLKGPAEGERPGFQGAPTASAGAGSRPLPDPGAAQRPDLHTVWWRALRVSLLSIGLALLLTLLQVLAMAALGTRYGGSEAARDTLLKIPWALIVCLSLALAITVAGDRAGAVALVGLISAPIASLLARSGAELAHAYSTVAAPAADPSPFLVAALKGVEYALLGLAVLWLRRQGGAAALRHAAAGILVGLLFGGILLILSLRVTAAPLTMATIAAWAINELLFPAGCALILSSDGEVRFRRAV